MSIPAENLNIQRKLCNGSLRKALTFCQRVTAQTLDRLKKELHLTWHTPLEPVRNKEAAMSSTCHNEEQTALLICQEEQLIRYFCPSVDLQTMHMAATLVCKAGQCMSK